MTANDRIKELFDNMSEDYDQAKVDHIVVQLLKTNIFALEAVEDLTQYLISNQGAYELKIHYTDLDYLIIEDFVK